ncbi:MAG: hypothetical protein KAS23_12620, partial [Anaerohalosphaera sp.]|nr:hypothetical protein [Anaerohalosphaera sp.]
WRVDVTDGGTEYPGTVWHFTTGGKATDPVPASGGTADRSAGVLSWSGDALVSSYDVYFGLPGDLQSVGNYTTTSVSFGDLATAAGQSVLAEGSYQWAVDTKDGSGTLMVAGDTWDVIIPEVEPVVIEDFDGYGDTSEMLANWGAGGGAALALEDIYSSMQFDYSGASDATLAFSPAMSWTATGMDTFVVSFLGYETNTAADISLTVSDGTTSATVTYPQSDATTISWWQKWYIRLSDFSDAGVAIDNITSVEISVASGSGTLRIDDLRLEVPGCIAAFQPVGDLNKDCQVTIEDLIMLAGDWLMKDFTVSPDTSDDDLLLAHYEFNEASGALASDSTSNNYHAAVTADDPGVIWNPSGYNSGCIELVNSVEVTIPAAVFNGVTNEVTISMWVNGDAADYPDKVNQFVFAAGATADDESSWDNAVWEIDSADAYGGQW